MQFQKFFLRLPPCIFYRISCQQRRRCRLHGILELHEQLFLSLFLLQSAILFHAYQVRCRKQQHSPHRPVKQPRCHSCRPCSHCRTSQFFHKTCPVFSIVHCSPPSPGSFLHAHIFRYASAGRFSSGFPSHALPPPRTLHT